MKSGPLPLYRQRETDCGETDCVFRCAFTQHRKLHTLLDGELEILHIPEMGFQSLANFFKLPWLLQTHDFYQQQLRRRASACGQRKRLTSSPCAFHEEFAVKDLLARSGVASKCNAGAGFFASVAENH